MITHNGRVGMACCVGPGALGSSMATANSPTAAEHVTAALLVIGDEILSGRTKDKNIGYIAEYLTALGIDLGEVRVVGGEVGPRVGALIELRHRHAYALTSGRIE